MAQEKLSISINIDTKSFIKGVRKMEGDMFVALSDFDELDSELNCMGINTKEDEE